MVLIVLATVLGLGATTLSVPSPVSSGLPLPLAAVAPLALAIVLGWALASSDPLVEAGAVRALGPLDAALVGTVTGVAALGVLSASVMGPPDIPSISGRDVIGYVGLMLKARVLLPRDAAALLPVGYLLFAAGCATLVGGPWTGCGRAVRWPGYGRPSWR